MRVFRNKKNISLFCVWSILIFFTISSIIILLQYQKLKNSRIILENFEKNILYSENNVLNRDYNFIISDLLYLRDDYANSDINPENQDSLVKRWQKFSNNKGVYDQIRFIDKDGLEKIRINYNEKGTIIVDNKDLQNKKDRYYFKDSINIKWGNIYISKIDLNIENNKIEMPIKPMIRFCTPYYDALGNLKGEIVLNYLAQNLVQNFKNISNSGTGEMFLLNSNGYWIVNKDENKEWSFMYEDKKDVSFAKEFVEEWQKIKNEENGQFYTKNGLITFKKISIPNKDNLTLDEGNLIAVSLVRSNEKNGYYLNHSLITGTIISLLGKRSYLIIIAMASIFISFLIILNKYRKDEIKYFAETDTMTNTYNRRAGLEILNNQYSALQKNKGLLSICFLDINGLKEVNDTFGHDSGDELIKSVVVGIKNCIRSTDFIIRLGGDEFIIIFPGTDINGAEKIWSRIKDEYDRINQMENRNYLVSVSHGIAEYSSEVKNSIDNLLSVADENMYIEKRELKKKVKIIRG